VVDDYVSYATNTTINFSGYMDYGSTSDHWAYLSGFLTENKGKYFFSYYSQNVTEERDTQGATKLLYDFYERHMEKIVKNLN
jgi:hypothetical protein